MKRLLSRPLPLAAAVCLALAAQFALAQSTGATTGTTTTTTTTASKPSSRLADSFTDFSGSPENATALVNGLRTGGAITLREPGTTAAGTTGTTSGTSAGAVTFTPPTKPMGYGNVRIALSLARTQLASQGITNPTPEQLQGALMGTSTTGPGGTTTTTQGVLQMRASGMGWGKIANTMGFKLGAVMSGKQPIGTTSTATGSTTAAQGGGRGSGVTTAAGTSAGTHGAGKHSAVTTGIGAGGSGKHSGVTTAAGQSGNSSGVGSALGHGSSASAGAVNAGGGKAGGAGVSHGGGKH